MPNPAPVPEPKGPGRKAGRKLVTWFRKHGRALPWRTDRNPYRTWVSEVMLQQTTADVVAPRYARFLARFPDLETLAAAPLDDVLDEWQGLGYYRRARALHAGAVVVVREKSGVIPDDLATLRSLPGVGDYTANAIRAFAHGLRAAPIDGNVARVLARLSGDTREVERANVRRSMQAIIHGLQGPDDAALVCEALIELGALVCRPREVDCANCPVVSFCIAAKEDRALALPTKRALRPAIPTLSARALLRRKSGVLLTQRPPDSSLLPGFWELPGAWAPSGTDAAAILRPVLRDLGLSGVSLGAALATVKHAITHHRITAVLLPADATGAIRNDAQFVHPESLSGRPLTTETRKLLRAAGVLS